MFIVFMMLLQRFEVTKSSYETELHKMTSHFELLTQNFLRKVFFQVTNSTS